MAEFYNGLFKDELIHPNGPSRNLNHVESATLNYVDWSQNRRLRGEPDYVPPTEFEAHNYGTTSPFPSRPRQETH
jgi:putative transposase